MALVADYGFSSGESDNELEQEEAPDKNTSISISDKDNSVVSTKTTSSVNSENMDSIAEHGDDDVLEDFVKKTNYGN